MEKQQHADASVQETSYASGGFTSYELGFAALLKLEQSGKSQLIRAEPSTAVVPAGIGCLLNRGVSMLLLFHRHRLQCKAMMGPYQCLMS